MSSSAPDYAETVIYLIIQLFELKCLGAFFRPWLCDPAPLLHGEVGDVGVGGDLELEDALGGGGVPVEHGAVHRGEGVAGDDGGLDGQFLDVRFGLLRRER